MPWIVYAISDTVLFLFCWLSCESIFWYFTSVSLFWTVKTKLCQHMSLFIDCQVMTWQSGRWKVKAMINFSGQNFLSSIAYHQTISSSSDCMDFLNWRTSLLKSNLFKLKHVPIHSWCVIDFHKFFISIDWHLVLLKLNSRIVNSIQERKVFGN